MKKQLTLFFGLVILILATLRCGSGESLPSVLKSHPDDPFREAMVKSQTFDINTKEDNVVEGAGGTVLVMPKGCFKDAMGRTVTGRVRIELAEALSLDQMLRSNLTTTSGGELLETDGMIFINATADGEQLAIDEDNPIHIEIPTPKRKPGMMAYKGTRDEAGNMDWMEPQELEKYLIPVDNNLLDFYPEGFESEAVAGLLDRGRTASKAVIDSLYYSLSVSDGSELIKGFTGTDYNEPHDNPNKEVVDGQYTDESFEYTQEGEGGQLGMDSLLACGIDPAIIKVIRSGKFQNTLLSTREFQMRLQRIFKTCQDEIIGIYIKNIDKNLWELDSMAAESLGEEHPYYEDFHAFYKQKLTNVRDAGKHAELLRGYYEKQLAEVKSELETARKDLVKELKEKNEIAKKHANKYKELLIKREKHRMETYGFEWRRTGWVNIDRGTNPKDWGRQKLEIIVEGTKEYDQVYAYVVYTSIRSLYRLNSKGGDLFHVGNDEERNTLMPKKKRAVAISIAYKNGTPYWALKEFVTGVTFQLDMTLQQTTAEGLEAVIRPYDDYGEGNKISEDLAYMELFAKEKKRQEKLRSERRFIQRLRDKAYPCCMSERGLGYHSH